MNFETSRIGKKVIEFKDDAGFENKPILQNFNLLVQKQDRIGIGGDRMVRQSTLLHLMLSDCSLSLGKSLSIQARVAYFLNRLMGWMKASMINFSRKLQEEVKNDHWDDFIADLLSNFFPRSMHGTWSKTSGRWEEGSFF